MTSLTGQPLLTVTDLTVRYGGIVALDSVSLTMSTGAIVGLIGPNGAGKTTFVDALTGFIRYSGTVMFRGAPLDGLPPHQRAHRGIARTFQAGGIFDDLTVEENVFIGERRAGGWRATLASIVAGRQERPQPATEETIRALGLEKLLSTDAGELSSGQRKLVAVAQALASRPEVLLLDEPAAGLDSAESLWLGQRLHQIRESGVTVLLVDHDMELVAAVCDEIVVLDFGKVIATGRPRDVLTDPQVVAAYLGTTTTSGIGAE